MSNSPSAVTQCYAITPANVHDSQVFDELLDTETRTAEDRKRPVYADSAYRAPPNGKPIWPNRAWRARSMRRVLALRH